MSYSGNPPRPFHPRTLTDLPIELFDNISRRVSDADFTRLQCVARPVFHNSQQHLAVRIRQSTRYQNAIRRRSDGIYRAYFSGVDPMTILSTFKLA